MSLRLISLFSLILFSNISKAQDFKTFVANKQWILVTEKAEKSQLIRFVPYSKNLVTLNTMIWEFKPNGRLEYDYQSSEDVEACLGVDFLDLDVDACTWRPNPATNTILLTLKGGYASIDDFILKNEYEFQTFSDENQMEGFELVLKKKVFFRNLN
ncbi:hypothetical protein [Lacihabitans soyangensis]|jgi:hypothetical protein|uniref:Lipocalin-like domain-containing protein n=1 Tax=Lacihabitans soyangensis TaxID=869394 RepID=A0AAE3GZT4_9BACT|nr:hypothetical protein [Lacihabitans soyangensis]MCP9761675.1 hypothetical protein [Lacihabitans soyangensis]